MASSEAHSPQPRVDSPLPIAFVTGGTGFIGSHLVEELLRRGYGEVRCLVRRELRWLEGLEVVPIRGDMADGELLRDGLQGVDYVYHVAGVTRATDNRVFEKGNVLATLALLDAVREAAPGVRRVLVTSSLAAVGRCPGGIATEEMPLDPISRYGASKARMEREVADWGRAHPEVPLVVVRPPSVYGPREADIYTFFKTVSYGICPVVGSGTEPVLTLVHVRDLVRGMVDAAESEKTVGETYFVGDDHAYSWNDVKAATTAALGRPAITLSVPGALVGAAGALVEGAGRLLGRYPPLNREKAREVREACKMCSSEKARRDFDYEPRVPLEEGVRETIAWYRREGWI